MQFSLNISKILILALLTLSFAVAILDFQHVEVSASNNEEVMVESPELAVSTPASRTTTVVAQKKTTPLIKKMTPIDPLAMPYVLPTKKEVQTKPVVVKPSTTVWNSITSDFKLDHQSQSPRVQAEIRKLLSEKGKFNKVLAAAAPYIYYIHLQTKTRGLPAELALIPYIESEFNPNDRSTKGAMGLWQLMSGTARLLGVKMSGGYDGRRNLVSSTKAALIYFKDLGKNFKGDWLLAIAAYNCGQGRVESAIRHAGSRSFWNLRVPLDTKYYVPRLLAVAEIIKNPNRYHIKLPNVYNVPYFSEFKIKKAIQLNQFAKTAGISLDALTRLNPDYKTGLIPKETAVLVPIHKATEKLMIAKNIA